ncbi:DNA-binding protein Bv3F [Paraburkholderia domus]|uniref:H-NS histone family protein n=1 Tax=Paraburkholderia domus TaxID=2793075 RepID=UPI001914AEBE|nr:H-NS histone family protein [Paraburkholderia domus]MBK5052920.1 H-NS histone family protein [Burkholderia sp. R-70006]CAE6822902.1 DNA-binding protein Bv3F [Paraburkholderia domus]
MASYKELLAQREDLEKRITTAYEAEVAEVVEKVREYVSQYNLTPDQVFGKTGGKRKRKTADGRPRYRDPVSGSEWSGMGRMPGWMKGKDKATFEIAS